MRGLTRDSQTTLATQSNNILESSRLPLPGKRKSHKSFDAKQREHECVAMCSWSQRLQAIANDRNDCPERIVNESRRAPSATDTRSETMFPGSPKKHHTQPWVKARSPQLGSDLLADWLKPTSASTSAASLQHCSASTSVSECSADRRRESVVGVRLQMISHEKWPYPPTKNRYGQIVRCYSERE